ncbi:MAG: MlaD family protein [Proteobacteria bacterium]|nr:MlaD family protein [Pseudomonadota bacterium]
MAKKTSNFLIGLFVTVGVLIGAVLIVWLSASKYFQKGLMFVTYFNESVQGLQLDSAVKYRGVDVGNVEKIRVAPDNKLIEVVMKVNLRGDTAKETVAQLKSAGITGIVFIELDQKKPAAVDLLPKIAFATEYPVIPSRPSDITRLLSGVDSIILQIKAIDFKGVSDQLQATVKAIETFLTSEKTNRITANLEIITAKIKTITGNVEKLTAEGKLEDLLGETRGFIADGRAFINTARDEIQTAGSMIDGLDRNSRTIAIDIKVVSENLRKTSESLDMLLERLNNSPSDIIFGRSRTTGRDE